MAKLRVDKIAAVGVSTETTGSVFFDGSGDHLAFTDSTDYDLGISNEAFSLEFWFYKLSAADTFAQLGLTRGGGAAAWNGSTGHSYLAHQNTDNKIYWQWWDGSDQREIVSTETPAINTWHHLAIQYDGTTTRGYLNGIEFGSATQGYAKPSSSNITRIGQDASGSTNCHAYISNLRVCKGHQVYTSDFTLPTRELDVHPQSILLVCHDGENIFADKTGRHTGEISAIGDRVSSPTPTATDSPIGITTFQPGLDRDVDNAFGPTFQGGVGYNSQNWLTLPKGTTEGRFPNFGAVDAGSARGVISGGYYDPAGVVNVIEYLTISTLGNTKDFGDLSTNHAHGKSGFASNTRGIFAGGGSPSSSSLSNNISYITITTTGNAKDFGDCITKTKDGSAAGNQIRGIFHASEGPSGTTATNSLQYVTIQTSGNSIEFGDLTIARTNSTGELSSPVRGIFMGGYIPSSPNYTNTIDYVTISTTSNAVDFGDMTEAKSSYGVLSNSTRGIRSGGNPSTVNTIDYITIATLGDAQDFGDLTTGLFDPAGTCASSIRGIIAGGYKSPAFLNVIQYVTISTLGNAQDFGDMTSPGANGAGLSNGHGGLG